MCPHTSRFRSHVVGSGGPVEKNRAFRIRDRALLSAIAVVSTFALLAPVDIFTRLPASSALANFFASFLPFVDGYTAVAVWPQLMRATLTLAAVIVVVVWPVVLWSQWQIQDVRKIQEQPVLRHWGWAVSVFALFPFIAEGPDLAKLPFMNAPNHLICQSRLALAIFASSMVVVEIILLTWPFIWVKSIFLKD